MIGRFLESPRAAHLASAKTRHAELEFLLAWPPPEAVESVGRRTPARRAGREDATAGQSAYLQGFLDVLYQDDAGGWHLLDYKTNQIDASGVDSEAQRYEMQMLVYALAVERILGQPPASIVLHFLRPSAEKNFRLDTAARRKLHGMVNQSIAAFVASG
jgi:ATP-dependent exoDNAse (exonuclease V) beta subunit